MCANPNHDDVYPVYVDPWHIFFTRFTNKSVTLSLPSAVKLLCQIKTCFQQLTMDPAYVYHLLVCLISIGCCQSINISQVHLNSSYSSSLMEDGGFFTTVQKEDASNFSPGDDAKALASTEKTEWPNPGWPEIDEDCEKICDQVDEEGIKWTACEGWAQLNCSGNATGHMYWECQANGEFKTSQPSYKNCSTSWIKRLQDGLESVDRLNYTLASRTLKLVESTTRRALRPSNGDAKYYGHEMDIVLDLAYRILTLVQEKGLDECENLTNVTMAIFDNVYVNINLWSQLSRRECTKVGNNFLSQTEERLLALSSYVYNKYPGPALFSMPEMEYFKNYDKSQFKPCLGVAQKDPNDPLVNQTLRFPFTANIHEDSYLELPPDWYKYAEAADHTSMTISFVGLEVDPWNANYLFPADDKVYEGNDTNDYYSSNAANRIEENSIVNGNILSFSFGKSEGQPADVKFNGTGVKIVFKHNVSAWGDEIHHVRRKLHPGETRKAVMGSANCSFWKPENLTWSTEGCVLVRADKDKTVCECFHLTAFALLMDLHDYVGRDVGLEILTWILTPLSILCLIVTILILLFLRTVKSSPRSIITRHLSLCLAVAMILMLTLMDKHYILTDDTTCAMTAVAIHYFLLCAFMWMSLEGILLYRMVVYVFESGREYIRCQVLAAYGLPLIIVAATLITSEVSGQVEDAYVGEAYCWLQGNYIWAFLGPVSVVLVMNLGILMISLRTAHALAHNKLPNKHAQKQGSNFVILIRGSFSISILLGLTWISGYFMFINNITVSNIAAYIFTILNAAQGIFLFVFHCLWNAKVREALGSKFIYTTQSNSNSTSNLHADATSSSETGSEKRQTSTSESMSS